MHSNTRQLAGTTRFQRKEIVFYRKGIRKSFTHDRRFNPDLVENGQDFSQKSLSDAA